MKDPVAGLLAIASVIAIIGGFIGLVVWLNKKRRQEFQSIAQALNLQFYPKGDERIAPLLVNLDFFHYGSNCKVTNLMHGRVARGSKSVTVAIFDYQFVVGRNRDCTGISFGENSVAISSSSDEDDEYFFQTLIVFHDEQIDVPRFKLREEHFGDKVANFIGFEDMNFPDFPVFSKRYRLDSDRVNEVRALFQPNLLKFYEGHKICTEANGSSVLIYPFSTNKSNTLAPDRIKAYLDIGLRLLSLLERNLVDRVLH
jgi:hypothetical protein